MSWRATRVDEPDPVDVREIAERRKERVETSLQRRMHRDEHRQRLAERIRALEPPRHAAERVADRGDVAIRGRKAVRAEIGDEPLHALGDELAMDREQVAHAIGKRIEILRAEARPLPREQMIEPDVEQDTGITPERRHEQRAGRGDVRVRIGVRVDRAMQRDAGAHVRRQRGIDAAAHGIADQAAEHEFGIGRSEQGVGEQVHRFASADDLPETLSLSG